jgi:anti-sigma regulatory factor (Ser/Thr protein kinase)
VTEVSFALPGGPMAAHLARTRLPGDGLPPARVAVLELLLSELVTNAVRHGGVTPDEWVRITFSPMPGCIRVSVTDRGPGFQWEGREDGKPLDGGGFGLLIVDRLATRWGIARTHEATTVWFELD